MYREIKQEELKVDKALGYIYFIDKEHPLSSKSVGRVYYHRHVAAIKEGRWLTSEEHVHHIDENKLNNEPSNLLILTAKEHGRIHQDLLCEEAMCPVCGSVFIQKNVRQVFCSTKCSSSNTRKLDGLSKEELEYLIWSTPYTLLGKKFNCSDNGVRKWSIRLGCILPPPRFHVKFTRLQDKQYQYFLMKEVIPVEGTNNFWR